MVKVYVESHVVMGVVHCHDEVKLKSTYVVCTMYVYDIELDRYGQKCYKKKTFLEILK